MSFNVSSQGEKHNVLAENGEEPCVEPAEALFARKAGETCEEPCGIVSLGDEADAGRLKRGEKNIGEESASDARMNGAKIQ